MKPRGIPAPWQRATATYAYEKGQPSRMVEVRQAIEADLSADEDEQP